jgi:hypothetical protein
VSRKLGKVFLFCAAVALVMHQPRPLAADSELALQVRPNVGVAPAWLRVRATVAPDARNRAIELTADSGNFYESSRRELDGQYAPKISELTLRDLPIGDYEIVVRVFDEDGGVRAVARHTVLVVGTNAGRALAN